MAEEQDKPAEKKPSGLGVKKISMGEYQPPEDARKEFEQTSRREFEQAFQAGYRPQQRQK